jgi:hypothetical protein
MPSALALQLSITHLSRFVNAQIPPETTAMAETTPTSNLVSRCDSLLRAWMYSGR